MAYEVCKRKQLEFELKGEYFKLRSKTEKSLLLHFYYTFLWLRIYINPFLKFVNLRYLVFKWFVLPLEIRNTTKASTQPQVNGIMTWITVRVASCTAVIRCWLVKGHKKFLVSILHLNELFSSPIRPAKFFSKQKMN